MGKFFTKIRHIRQICPKWANALRQLLGNQIDRGTAIDIHVRSQSSCLQENALAFYHKCTHNKEQAFIG